MILNELQASVAKRIHDSIMEQSNWVKSQQEALTNAVLTGSANGFNLRQNCQAMDSGERALSALKAHFKSFVGIEYDEYCIGIEVAPVTTAEERLLSAIKELMNK